MLRSIYFVKTDVSVGDSLAFLAPVNRLKQKYSPRFQQHSGLTFHWKMLLRKR